MAGFGEPWQWTKQREEEAKAIFPTLEVANPDEIMDVDSFRVQNLNQGYTNFSQSALSLANYANIPEPTPEAPDVAPNVEGWTPQITPRRRSIYDEQPAFGTSTEEMAAGKFLPSAPAPELQDPFARRLIESPLAFADVGAVGRGFVLSALRGEKPWEASLTEDITSYRGIDTPIVQLLPDVGARFDIPSFVPLLGGTEVNITPRTVAGLALEIVADPTTYIGTPVLDDAVRLVGTVGKETLQGIANGARGSVIPRIGTWMQAADEALGVQQAAERAAVPEALQVGRAAGEGRVPFYGGTRPGEVPVPLQQPSIFGAAEEAVDQNFARIQRMVDETGAYAEHNGITVAPTAGSKGEAIRNAIASNFVGTADDVAEAAAAQNGILQTPVAKTLEDLFKFQIPKRGLNLYEKVENKVRNLLGYPTLNEEVATPAAKEWRNWRRNVSNVANAESEIVKSELLKNFKFDDNYRMTDLAGKVAGFDEGPTFADFLANKAQFEPFLTPKQAEAVDVIINNAAKYNEAARAINPELGVRSDIKPGGEYWHRVYESSKDRRISGASRSTFGRKSYEKIATLASDLDAIKAGRTPVAPWDAYGAYIEDVGKNAADKYLDMYSRATVGSKTPKDFIPETLRKNWESLNSKLSSARRTANAQEVRISQQQQELERATRATGRSIGELAESSVRRGRLLENYDTQDLRIARNAVNESIDNLVSITDEVASSAAQIRAARIPLTQEERALERKALELKNAIAEAEGYANGASIAEAEAAFAPFESGALTNLPEEQITPQQMRLRARAARRIGVEYNKAMRVVDKLERQYEAMFPNVERLSSRVDDLIEKGQIDKDLEAAARQERVEARQYERRVNDVSRRVAKADREIELLERFANRASAVEESAAGRLGISESARAKTLENIEKLKQAREDILPDWERAKELARSAQEGMGQISDIGSMRGRSFPLEFSNAINRITREEFAQPGKYAGVLEAAKAINSIHRLVAFGIDVSNLGLQGLLGLASDPRAYGTALKVGLRSLGDEAAYGAYLKASDEARAAAGRLTNRELSASGLHFSKIGGEIAGESIPSKISSLIEADIPGLKQLGVRVNPIRALNRQFEVFGNVLRSELADTAIEIAQNSGRDISAETKSIVRAANRMTGWTERRFAGDWGELINIAPRYFESNLETVVSGLRGALPGAAQGDIQSRNALIRLIGLGTLFTEAWNYAHGEETDHRPIIDGRINRQFMRMKNGDQSRSIFGQYERLFHLAVLGVTGEYTDIARNIINSAVASTAWNIFSGENPAGKPVEYTPAGIAKEIVSPFTPAAPSEYATGAKDIYEGKISEGLFAAISGSLGLRGGEISPAEKARRGGYYRLQGEEQLQAIPAATWTAMKTDQMPEQFRQITSMYNTYGAWRDAAIKEYEQQALNAGFTQSNAKYLAENAVNKHPISKIYVKTNTALETQWVANNPELAEEVLQKEMNFLPEKRRFSVNRPERQIIQAAAAEQ